MTIGVTGVTGHLGAYVAQVLDQVGVPTIHLARSPHKAKPYASAQVRQAFYDNSPITQEALQGVDVLLMVSARENPNRVAEHKGLIDAAKAAGVSHIVYISFYNNSLDASFTLARDHAHTEAYIKAQGLTYTFLRDNFYLDFFVDMCLSDGKIQGPADDGRCSAVARKDAAQVAAQVLLHPDNYRNHVLDLTGPANLTMADIVAAYNAQVPGASVVFVNETIPEAYQSRQVYQAQDWEYDAWVSTYTAISRGEQEGLSGAVEAVLGRPATSLEEVIQEKVGKKG